MGVGEPRGPGNAPRECYRNLAGKIVLDASTTSWNKHEKKCLDQFGYDFRQKGRVFISVSFENPEEEDFGLQDPNRIVCGRGNVCAIWKHSDNFADNVLIIQGSLFF